MLADLSRQPADERVRGGSVLSVRAAVGAYQLRWRSAATAPPTARQESIFWDLMLQAEAHALACAFATGDKAAPAKAAALHTALQLQCRGALR